MQNAGLDWWWRFFCCRCVYASVLLLACCICTFWLDNIKQSLHIERFIYAHDAFVGNFYFSYNRRQKSAFQRDENCTWQEGKKSAQCGYSVCGFFFEKKECIEYEYLTITFIHLAAPLSHHVRKDCLYVHRINSEYSNETFFHHHRTLCIVHKSGKNGEKKWRYYVDFYVITNFFFSYINALYFDVQLQMITTAFDNPSLCKDLYLRNLISVVIEGKIKRIQKTINFSNLFLVTKMTSRRKRLSIYSWKKKFF